jgi:diguanylate cyclase (GGDEF)-like protein
MQPAFHAIGAPCESGPSVRHESQNGPAVSDDGRRPDSGSAGGHPRGRRLFPLSIRASLIVVLLVPLLMAVGLASTVVVHQLSTRQQAVTARQSSLALDSLLRARVAIYAEYIPSQAIVTARSYHISSAALDSLLGADVQTNLVDSRRSVDHQAAFGSTGVFHTEYAQLVRLRRSIDQSTASPTDVATLFNGVGSKMEARWEQTFGQLSDTSASSDSPTTKSRLTALGLSFSAFSSGLAEENLPGGGSLETVLTVTATPAQVESLIVSRQQFEASTRSFPGSLGPNGAAAWESLNDDPLTNRFSGYFQTGIAVGLGHLAPPYAVSSSEIGEIARSLVAWASSLASLVLASSSDLRTASTDQAASATQAFVITVVLMLLLVLLAVGAALVLGRQVRRPLARIVAAATSVREGELEIPALDESGPKELALAAAAFNEMASTLRAVQAQAIVLSEGDLDDPVLKRQLPGRTGAALQMALNQLHRSAKASETERQALLERATRDSLTGLLNRGAALEALELDLASARRSQGELVLTLFFIDLDDLKTINDTIGHEGGDAAIRAVADALRVTTRASDVIARFGGDEFVVGWLGNSDSDVPEHLAKRIGAHVARSEIGADGHSMALACSIGVAVSVPSDRTVEALIERADRALYEAKADGRGQIHWFGRIGPADSPVAAER